MIEMQSLGNVLKLFFAYIMGNKWKVGSGVVIKICVLYHKNKK